MSNYRKLKDELDESTKYHSSSCPTLEHPNFNKIMEIEGVIPHLLQDLVDDRGVHSCFLLLSKITGNNPIKEENRGKVDEMVKDWLAWANAMSDWKLIGR